MRRPSRVPTGLSRCRRSAYYYTGTAVAQAVPAQLHGNRRVRRRRRSRSTTAKSARSSSQTSFSPPPPTQTDSLCWEANVITFNSSNVLGSKNVANIPTTFVERLGVAELPVHRPAGASHQLIGGAIDGVQHQVTGRLRLPRLPATTFNGLPVIGFAAQTFENGTLTSGGINVQSNYGGNFIHKYTRSIQ